MSSTEAKIAAAQSAHDALMKSLQEQFETSEKSLKGIKEAETPALKLVKIALKGKESPSTEAPAPAKVCIVHLPEEPWIGQHRICLAFNSALMSNAVHSPACLPSRIECCRNVRVCFCAYRMRSKLAAF